MCRLSLRRSVVFTLGALAAVAARARAGDAEGESARIDLGVFRAGPAVAASKALWVPTDEAMKDAWRGEPGDDASILSFEGPPFEQHAVGSDVVEDLVRRMVPESAGAGWASRAAGDTLEVWSSPEGLERARGAVRFVQSALAPRLAVRAVLTATRGSATRLLAAGSVRLLPRRWTSVWQRTHVRRFVTGYEIEIAQESTANHPTIAALPEGEELDLRWSPGESAHVLEVFATDVNHLAPFAADLSGIRQVPEANAPGPVELPRTAVLRVLTAVRLDAKAPGTAECVWDGPDGVRTLRLSVDAAPPPPVDVELPTGALGVVRAGAAYGSLDAEMRENRLDDAIQRYQAGGSARARGAASPEQFAQAFLVCEGSRPQIDRLRAQASADEATLSTATVEVRVAAVPAAVLKEDVDAGRLAIGAALDAGTAAPYLRAPVLASARLPVLVGVAAQVRCGASVVGFAHSDVEVAQQAGGVVVEPVASFDGLFGRVRVRPLDGTLALHFAGGVAWARPDASTLQLAFRRPMGMTTSENPTGTQNRVDNPEVRTFAVPLEAHGRASVDATVALTPEDLAQGRWVVLALAMRPAPDGPAEPLLLLGSVRR